MPTFKFIAHNRQELSQWSLSSQTFLSFIRHIKPIYIIKHYILSLTKDVGDFSLTQCLYQNRICCMSPVYWRWGNLWLIKWENQILSNHNVPTYISTNSDRSQNNLPAPDPLFYTWRVSWENRPVRGSKYCQFLGLQTFVKSVLFVLSWCICYQNNQKFVRHLKNTFSSW